MHTLPQPSSLLLDGGFTLLALAAIAFWIWASAYGAPSSEQARRYRWSSALVLVAWAGISAWLAMLDGFHDFDVFPPPGLRLFLVGFVGTAVVAFSPFGRRLARALPSAVLVGFQAFRIPVELLLHRAYEEGLAPIQMTYLGRNFDIAAGLGASVLAVLLIRGSVPGWVIGAWNLISLGLLLNIVGIAILSMPSPIRAFAAEPANVFVTFVPFVWLPTLLVTSALLGHLLVFRALSAAPPAEAAE